jgi:hypothetical protein
MCMRHFVKPHQHDYRLSGHVAITVLHSGGLQFAISRISAILPIIVVFPLLPGYFFFVLLLDGITFFSVIPKSFFFLSTLYNQYSWNIVIKWNYNISARRQHGVDRIEHMDFEFKHIKHFIFFCSFWFLPPVRIIV